MREGGRRQRERVGGRRGDGEGEQGRRGGEDNGEGRDKRRGGEERGWDGVSRGGGRDVKKRVTRKEGERERGKMEGKGRWGEGGKEGCSIHSTTPPHSPPTPPLSLTAPAPGEVSSASPEALVLCLGTSRILSFSPREPTLPAGEPAACCTPTRPWGCLSREQVKGRPPGPLPTALDLMSSVLPGALV